MKILSDAQYQKMVDHTAILVVELEKAHAQLQAALKHAYLIGLEREGRTNKFVFVRRGEVHAIETMGLLGDDFNAWRKNLIESDTH